MVESAPFLSGPWSLDPEERSIAIGVSGLVCYTCIEPPGSSMLALRLPPDIEERLNKLAKRTGRSKSYYAREAILEHLDDLEDIYLAERELEAIRSGAAQTISLDDLMKRYGMAD
jgi:RHH-type transcriptional regulator, rel operon repressor / antitoxin RelB